MRFSKGIAGLLVIMLTIGMVSAAVPSQSYDFESGNMPSDIQTSASSNGNIAVDGTNPIAGNYSLVASLADDADGTPDETSPQVVTLPALSELDSDEGLAVESDIRMDAEQEVDITLRGDSAEYHFIFDSINDDITVQDGTGSEIVNTSVVLNASEVHTIRAGQDDSGTITASVDGSQLISTSATDLTNVTAEMALITQETNQITADNIVVESTNTAPVADFQDSDNAETATVNTSVELNASASTDADSDALTYSWDLDQDGNFTDATGETVSVSESTNGTYEYTVLVEDEHGVTDTATFTLTVEEESTSGGSAILDGSDPLGLGEVGGIGVTYIIVAILALLGLGAMVADDGY